MMNDSIVLATVKKFNGKNSDSKPAIIFEVIAGKYPSKRVLSQVIADNEGFVIGNTYLAKVSEREPSEEYGRQFQWSMVAKASVMEILSGAAQLGDATKIDVTDDVEAKQAATAKQAAANFDFQPVTGNEG